MNRKILCASLAICLGWFFLTGCEEQNKSNTNSDLDASWHDIKDTSSDTTPSSDFLSRPSDSENSESNEVSDVFGNPDSSVSSTGGSLNVPRNTQIDGHTCGPASMGAVFATYGDNRYLGAGMRTIDNQVYVKGQGASPDAMVRFARNNGFPDTKQIMKGNDSLSSLAQRVASGRPQIVRVGPTGSGPHSYNYPKSLNPGLSVTERSMNNGHFIVVKGFTASGDPIIMDPARQAWGNVVAPKSWFQKYWTYSIDMKK